MTDCRMLARYAVVILSVSFAGFDTEASAQEKVNPTDTGSLAALTAEVRQLRLAVEESTQRQVQTQALGVYLSAQQSRITQVGARLDATRRELDAVATRSRELANTISGMNEVLLRDPQARAGLEPETKALKQELESVSLQEQQLRSREAELSQMLRAEDSRWTDLVSALETLIKK